MRGHIRSLALAAIACNGLLMTLTGCAKPYETATVEESLPGNLAAPPSSGFPGISTLMEGRDIKVFWTHGMCSHDERWAQERLAIVAYALGTTPPRTVRSTTTNDDDPFTIDATIQASGGRANIRYFVWSPLTTKYKSEVQFDNGAGDKPPGLNKYERATLNGVLKKGLMNDCLVDAVVYSGLHGNRIRTAMQHALCQAIGGEFTLPVRCNLRSNEEDSPLVFIAESLGSKLLFDAIRDLWRHQDPATQVLLSRKLGATRMVYMAANQIPLLDTANPLVAPGADGPMPENAPQSRSSLGIASAIIQAGREQRRPAGSFGPVNESATMRDPWTIVAFTDPNDLLSYRLLPRVIGRNEEAPRQPDEPRLLNVIVSNGDTILGYVERPDTAHCGYRWNPHVLGMIIKGYQTGQKHPTVSIPSDAQSCF